MSPKEEAKKALEFETSYIEFIDSEVCGQLNTEANDLFFKALRATYKAVCPTGVEYEKLFSKFIGSAECGDFNHAFNTIFYKVTNETHKSAYAAGYDDGRLAGYDECRGTADAYDEGRLVGIAEAFDEEFSEEGSVSPEKQVKERGEGLMALLRRKMRGGMKVVGAGKR